MCGKCVIRHSFSPLAAAAETLPTAVELADAAATPGKVKGCPA